MDSVGLIEADILLRLEGTSQAPLIVGLCGAQGSGKSTATAALAENLSRREIKTAILSLDDLYLSYEHRKELGHEIHPLLETRGVPGTHNVPLGISVLRDLANDGLTALPRFNKATDNPYPAPEWPQFSGPADVILFEGWCVGAVPQSAKALIDPCNALERERDQDGRWRRLVNAALTHEYQRLFRAIDMLILLAAPSFDLIVRWRGEQEEALRTDIAATGGDTSRLMNNSQLMAFIQHYERLTRHILQEMPHRADLVIRLDEMRRPIEVVRN